MDGYPKARGPEYVSFLLRLWRVDAQGAPAWRISLQRPGSTEAISLPDLETLLAFLQSEMKTEDADQAARFRIITK